MEKLIEINGYPSSFLLTPPWKFDIVVPQSDDRNIRIGGIVMGKIGACKHGVDIWAERCTECDDMSMNSLVAENEKLRAELVNLRNLAAENEKQNLCWCGSRLQGSPAGPYCPACDAKLDDFVKKLY